MYLTCTIPYIWEFLFSIVAVTIVPEYAFGSSESQQELGVVPPNSTIYYEVELVSFDKVSTLGFLSGLYFFFLYNRCLCTMLRYLIIFTDLQDKESWDMNTQEKIEAAGKKKEEGNALFKAGKYERASKRYEKVNS